MEEGIECIDLARKGGPGSRIKRACVNCRFVLLPSEKYQLIVTVVTILDLPSPNVTMSGHAGTALDANLNVVRDFIFFPYSPDETEISL